MATAMTPAVDTTKRITTPRALPQVTTPQSSIPAQPSVAASTPTPVSQTTSAAPGVPQALGVSLTPTNANTDLRGQTITPGPMANRADLAKQYVENMDKLDQPYFERDMRTATSNAAAKGQIGSGQLRSSLGDVVENRTQRREAAASNFYTNAMEGAINDAYRNVGIAQQQQQFQANQQNQTFNQQLTLQQLDDALTNSSFNRGLTQYQVGRSGNPSDLQLALSGMYSNQAAQGMNALSGLIGNTVGNNSASSQTSDLQKLLESLGVGGSVGGGITPPYIPASDPVYSGVYG